MKCANSNIEVTCHFSRIMRESHSCDWLLTHISERIVLKHTIYNENSVQFPRKVFQKGAER